MTIAFTNSLGSLYQGDTLRPRGQGYGARLGDLWVRLASAPDTPIRVYTQDSLAGRQADASNFYENVLEIGYAFSRQDLTGGEGLDFFPRRNQLEAREVDEIRYFDSCNIDLREQRDGQSQLNKLSKKHELWYTAAATISRTNASRLSLYVAAGQFVYRFADDADTTPDATVDLGSNVVSFSVSENDQAAALLASGDIAYKPIGTDVWTTVAEPVAGDWDGMQSLWLVKDRIVAWAQDTTDTAAKAELYEIGLAITGTPASPSITATKTVIDTFFGDLLALADAGIAILASIDDGTIRAYVPQVDSAGDAPLLTIRGQSPMPRGENAIAIGHNLGQLLILTVDDQDIPTVSAYSARMLDERFNYVVGEMQQVRVWEGVTQTEPYPRVVATRDEMLWLITEPDGDTYLWRYALATTGVFRHSQVLTGEAVSLINWADREYMVDDDGLYRTSDLYHDEGWLILPNVTSGLHTNVNWLTTTFIASDILDGQGRQAEFYVSTDPDSIGDNEHTTWQLISRYSNSISTSDPESSLDRINGSSLTGMVRLYSSQSGTSSPSWTRVGIRGIPTHRDWIVELPISVSDQVEAPGRIPITVPGLGNSIHTALSRLNGTHLEARLLDPPIIIRGVVNAQMTPVEYLSDRGSVGHFCMVQILGSRIEDGSSATSTGNEGLGVGLLGVAILGIGQSGV